MTRSIAEINKLLSGSREIDLDTYEGIPSKISLNEKSNKEDLDKCDSYFQFRLPDDYLLFLENFNGGIFFQVNDIAGFQFWGCKELIKWNAFHKEHLGDDWDNRIILICASLGDGDYIGLKLFDDETYEVIDAFGEEIPANWNKIGDSFDDFLLQLIETRGKKFWL